MTHPEAPIDEDVRAELKALRHDIAQAADAILLAVESGLSDLDDPVDAATALHQAKAALYVILETCAFQDLTGQRISRVEALLSGGRAAFKDPLLNGPALSGQGLDQASADALFAEMDASNGTHPWPPSLA